MTDSSAGRAELNVGLRPARPGIERTMSQNVVCTKRADENLPRTSRVWIGRRRFWRYCLGRARVRRWQQIRALGNIPHREVLVYPAAGSSSWGPSDSAVSKTARFAEALSSHRLLNAHYTELLTTGRVATPLPRTKYAFGFEDHTSPNGVRYFGHNGGAPGMNGRLSIFPESGYLVVVLANRSARSGQYCAIHK
jgi:hypothetical protein